MQNVINFQRKVLSNNQRCNNSQIRNILTLSVPDVANVLNGLYVHCISIRVETFLHFTLTTLLQFASMLLHFALHFEA